MNKLHVKTGDTVMVMTGKDKDTKGKVTKAFPATGKIIVEGVALRDALGRFLRSAPEKTRKIFIRRYWYAASVEDIAEEYGMSKNSVLVLLHRTRKKLKKFLEKEGYSV